MATSKKLVDFYRLIAKTMIEKENARIMTICERGDECIVKTKPTEIWLDWAEGNVWYEPSGGDWPPPVWAQAIRGTWDHPWRYC